MDGQATIRRISKGPSMKTDLGKGHRTVGCHCKESCEESSRRRMCWWAAQGKREGRDLTETGKGVGK